MRSCLLIVLVLVTAACTSDGDDADSLSQILRPSTTLPPPSSSTTSTTSTATTPPTTAVGSPTTTITESTEVLGTGDTAAQALEELPRTGGELQVALVALAALLVGGWLLHQARIAQSIIDRIRSNLSHH